MATADTGVATLHYLPYAVFNIASPLLTIAITATGLRVLHAAPAPQGRAEPHAPLAGDGRTTRRSRREAHPRAW